MSFKTPGVYVKEITKFPPSVPQVATAVPVFMGYTNKNANTIQRIASMADYELYFGPAKSEAITVNVANDGTITITNQDATYFLYYSLQMYFTNGGGPCYVASTGLHTAAPDKQHFEDALNDLIRYEDEITLLVPVDAVSMASADYYYVIQKCLEQCNKLQDRFTIIDLQDNGSAATQVATDATTLRGTNGVGVNYLKYGAAYTPYLNTTITYPDYAVKIITGTTIGNYTSTLQSTIETSTLAIRLYLTDIRNALAKYPIVLPPSAAIAGIYGMVDRERGVWKAPANVSLSAVTGTKHKINDAQQEGLNVDETGGKSINAIRSFTGKGTLVWGARTLAGNDNEWRYVSVRRLYITVEESIKKSTSWAVFEPNDANTWVRIKAQIENYLTGLWRDGALAGATAEDAFYVAVGLGSTMTSQDILEGNMNIEIGMAAVRPAEFIVLKFSHKLQTS